MKNNNKIQGFDYIKIIAASLLVFHHYQQVFECKFAGINFYGGHIEFGFLVELFFTISGYLTLYSEKTNFSGWKRFVHKLSRIYPMVFISILVCLFLKTLISIITNGTLIELWNLKTLIANFALLFAGYPYFDMLGINNPVWYVCVLIQCYILYYIFEFIFKKLNINSKIHIRLITYEIIVVLAVVTHHYGILNEASFRGIVSFSIGIVICSVNWLLSNKNFINENNCKSISLLLFILSAFSCGIALFRINQRYILQFFVFPFLVWSMVNARFSDVSVVSRLGDISFELYVIHYPLMVLLQLVQILTGYTLQHSYTTMVLFLIFAWVISGLMWKYIDLPIRNKVKEIKKL